MFYPIKSSYFSDLEQCKLCKNRYKNAFEHNIQKRVWVLQSVRFYRSRCMAFAGPETTKARPLIPKVLSPVPMRSSQSCPNVLEFIINSEKVIEENSQLSILNNLKDLVNFLDCRHKSLSEPLQNSIEILKESHMWRVQKVLMILQKQLTSFCWYFSLERYFCSSVVEAKSK